MAISPTQLNETFIKDVNKLESKIDSILIKMPLTRNGNIIIEAPTELNNTHMVVLRERYINAGWKDVIYCSEQLNGDWLEFHS